MGRRSIFVFCPLRRGVAMQDHFFKSNVTSGSRQVHTALSNDFLYLLFILTRSHIFNLGLRMRAYFFLFFSCVKKRGYICVYIYTLCVSCQNACSCDFGTYRIVIAKKISVSLTVFLLCMITEMHGGFQ